MQHRERWSGPRQTVVPWLAVRLLLVLAFTFAAESPAVVAQTISFVQVNSAVPTSTATISAAYSSAQAAGNLNIVAIGWDSATITVNSVADTEGNSYKLAVSYVDSNGISQAIYYAPNIVAAAAGANTVTATLSASTGYPDLRILEYSGVNTLDKTASAQGTSTTASSGSVTTTQASELLFGAVYTYGTTNGPGSGYTSRVITGDSDLAEDQVVSATASYSATASVSNSEWVTQLATFYLTGGGTPPAAPTGLTATAASSSQINLSWTAPSGATSYNVLRSTTSGGPYSSIASGVTTTNYLNTGLSSGTTYYYVVKAVNSAGISGNSSQASATTVSAAPTGLTATAASSSQINLSWTAPSGATSYNVLRSTTSGGPYSSIATGVTTNSYSNTGLTASTTYYYVVQAVNSGGTSGNSSQVSATTSGGGTVPAAPTGLTATAASSSQINLNWTASTGAASYNVLNSTTSGGPYSSIATGVAATSYSNTGLSSGTIYYYVVQAVNSAGTSSNSNQASAITVPAAPTGLTATAASSSQINLGWTASTGAASYNVLNSTISGGPYSSIATGVTTNSYSNTGLTASATYYYVVQAVNSGGTSGNSSQASATTQSQTSGLTFYVSTTGNDANNGSSSSPWRTIQHAAGLAHAGDTIDVYGGVYNEAVTFTASGNSTAGYITFQSYPGQTAIIDGTGLSVGGQSGLINISAVNYLVVKGFEVRNFSTSNTSNVPVGIWITGADSYIQILNNHIHNIKTSASGCNANALGLAVYGKNGSNSINNLTISGNELDHLTTGCSESMSINGNVQNWSVTNNLIHDNNNIGIDAIGFEGTSPNAATDQARDGVISGNTVYNITSYGNPAYGNAYSADGIYCDGCTRVTIERNRVHNVDFGIEVASEHSGKTSSYVTVRSNLVYNNNASGLTIGGYDAARGGTDHCNFVNNTFYNNDTKNTSEGEFQIQYYATNNIFKNNIVYAGSQGLFLNSYTNSSANPVDADYNLYYLPAGAASSSWTWNGTSYSGFSSYQSGSGKDAHSIFADPQFTSTSTPDLHVSASSPANDAGINLGSSVVGTVDFAGNPRVQGVNIDIGAYEQ